MVTKRGGNTWHGTLYEYYYDNNWNGNTWTIMPAVRREIASITTALASLAAVRLSGRISLAGSGSSSAISRAFRWPNTTTFYRAVPSDLMKQGILQFKDSTGAVQQYNLSGTGTMATCLRALRSARSRDQSYNEGLMAVRAGTNPRGLVREYRQQVRWFEHAGISGTLACPGLKTSQWAV